MCWGRVRDDCRVLTSGIHCAEVRDYIVVLLSRLILRSTYYRANPDLWECHVRVLSPCLGAIWRLFGAKARRQRRVMVIEDQREGVSLLCGPLSYPHFSLILYIYYSIFF